MVTEKPKRGTRRGDLVVVAGRRLGAPEQVGEILEVIGTSREHYRVRWEDGHESLFFPGSDTTIRRARSAR